MEEESDWELMSDSEPSDSSVKVHVELPPACVLPNQGSTSKSLKTSSNSTESFSIIDGINALGVQSQTGSSFSSYAQLSSNESCVGSSICGQFDVISLSSGEVFFRCKKCQGRHPEGTPICTACGLPQLANPCVEIDSQIALAQQQRENKMALEALEFEERELQNLANESLFNKATFLARKLMIQLEAHQWIIQDLHEMDLVNRVNLFLDQAYALFADASARGANLNLASGYVVMYQAEDVSVRLHGFRSDMNVHISRALTDAVKRGPQKTSNEMHYPSTRLSPISENALMQKPLTSMCIVFAVGSSLDFGGRKVDLLVRGGTVMPLAWLQTDDLEGKSDEIESLTKVLFQVIDDTFIHGLHLKQHSIAQSSASVQVVPKKSMVSSKSQTESGHKRNNPDQPFRIEGGCRPKVPRKSAILDATAVSVLKVDSIKLIHQETIDMNRNNRFGILSFFMAGGSMKHLEGLDHDTRTSLRLYNVPFSDELGTLLHEFERHGFPPVKFSLVFLPSKPGYRPGILFLDFVDYKDIPEFCQLFCSKSKNGYHFRPEYTKHQGKAALTAYFGSTPFGYNPFNHNI